MDSETVSDLSLLLGAATLLFGGVISASLGAFVSHVFSQQRDDREYRLTKIEIVATTLLGVQRQDYIASNVLLRYCFGEIAKNDYDAALTETQGQGHTIDNVQVTVLILFPTLQGRLLAWMECRSNVTNAELRIKLVEGRESLLEISKELEAKRDLQAKLFDEWQAALIQLSTEIREGSVIKWVKEMVG
jgi:hypothetical protein